MNLFKRKLRTLAMKRLTLIEWVFPQLIDIIISTNLLIGTSNLASTPSKHLLHILKRLRSFICFLPQWG